MSNDHRCHWPLGCRRLVRPAMWGCPQHWYMLPLALRKKVWDNYRPGQEVDKTPSTKYLEVIEEVREWVKEHHGTVKR